MKTRIFALLFCVVVLFTLQAEEELIPYSNLENLGNSIEDMKPYILPLNSQDGYIRSFRPGIILQIHRAEDAFWGSYIDLKYTEQIIIYGESRECCYTLRFSHLEVEKDLRKGMAVEELQTIGRVDSDGPCFVALYCDVFNHPYLTLYSLDPGQAIGNGIFLYPPHFLGRTGAIEFLKYHPTEYSFFEVNLHRQMTEFQQNRNIEENSQRDNYPYRFYFFMEMYPEELSSQTKDILEVEAFLNQVIEQGAVTQEISREWILQRGEWIYHYCMTENIYNYLINEIETGSPVYLFARNLGAYENHAFIYVSDFSQMTPEEFIEIQWDPGVDQINMTEGYRQLNQTLQESLDFYLSLEGKETGETLPSEELFEDFYRYVDENLEIENQNSLRDLVDFSRIHKFSIHYIKETENAALQGFRLTGRDGQKDLFILSVPVCFKEVRNQRPEFYYSSLLTALEESYAYISSYYLEFPHIQDGFITRYRGLMNSAYIQALYLAECSNHDDLLYNQEKALLYSMYQDNMESFSNRMIGLRMEMIYQFSDGYLQARRSNTIPEFVRVLRSISSDAIMYFRYRHPESMDEQTYNEGVNLWSTLLCFSALGEQISRSKQYTNPLVRNDLEVLLENLSYLERITENEPLYGEKRLLAIQETRSNLLLTRDKNQP